MLAVHDRGFTTRFVTLSFSLLLPLSVPRSRDHSAFLLPNQVARLNESLAEMRAQQREMMDEIARLKAELTAIHHKRQAAPAAGEQQTLSLSQALPLQQPDQFQQLLLSAITDMRSQISLLAHQLPQLPQQPRRTPRSRPAAAKPRTIPAKAKAGRVSATATAKRGTATSTPLRGAAPVKRRSSAPHSSSSSSSRSNSSPIAKAKGKGKAKGKRKAGTKAGSHSSNPASKTTKKLHSKRRASATRTNAPRASSKSKKFQKS